MFVIDDVALDLGGGDFAPASDVHALEVPIAPQLSNSGFVDAEHFTRLHCAEQYWIGGPIDLRTRVGVEQSVSVTYKLPHYVAERINDGGWNNNRFSPSHASTKRHGVEHL